MEEGPPNVEMQVLLVAGEGPTSEQAADEGPAAAVTNDHKVSALKLRRFILSELWRPEV